MSFFSRIASILKMLYNSVFGKAVIDTASQLIGTVGKAYADMLMVEAQRAALEAEGKYTAPGSGLEKRKYVEDYLQATVKNSGFLIAANLINFIIEGAVAKLSSSGELKVAAPTS